MTNSSNTLADEHEEIIASFANNRYIIVSPSEENPHQKYEIEYKVKGAQLQDDGTVNVCENHRVVVSIPFGYPSFPPSCKPISSIYHPDFDPAAICINDFWTESSTLKELIVYIGRMISGQKFNQENTYNDEATKWYIENKDILPFDPVDLNEKTEPELDIEEGSIAADESHVENNEQSTSEESAQNTVVQPGLEIEMEEIDNTEDEPLNLDGLEDAEPIELDEPTPRTVQDSSILTEQPDGSTELDLDIDSDSIALEELEFENVEQSIDGNTEQDNVGQQNFEIELEEELVSDEPELPIAPNSSGPSEQLSTSEQSDSPVTPAPPAPLDTLPGSSPNELPNPGRQIASRNTEMAEQFAVETTHKRKKMLIGGGIVSILLLLGAPGYFIGMDIKNYSNAETIWQDADNLLNGKQFKAVEKKGQSALVHLASVRFFKKQDSENLTKKINNILKSEKFKGGLAGKVLFEGRYLSTETIKIMESVKKMMRSGDSAFTIEKWQKSLVFYEEAQELIKGNNEIDQTLVDKVNLAAAKAQLNIYVQEGESFLAEGALEEAINSLQKAAEIANTSPNITKEKISHVYNLLDKTLVQKFIQDGEGAFSAIDLDKALNNFNQALLLAEKEGASDPEHADNIRRSIKQVKLYQLLNKGKKAIESAQWDDALASFEDALNSLVTNRASSNKMTANEQAIREKIVHIKINKNRSLSGHSRMQKNLQEAVRLEQDIIKIIESSQFSGKSVFSEIKKESQKEIVSLRSEIDINEKIEYLKTNYKEIFRKNHSLARSAKLSYPTITFVKKTGNGQLFNLQCTGRTTTGKISLELNYQYDLGQKKWGLAGG